MRMATKAKCHQVATLQISTLPITLDLIRDAVKVIGAFKLSSAPRKIRGTLAAISMQMGVLNIELSNFVRQNFTAFEILLREERNHLIKDDLSQKLHLKDMAAKYGITVSALTPHLSAYRHSIGSPDQDRILQTKSFQSPLKIPDQKLISLEEIVEAIILSNPFKALGKDGNITSKFYSGLSSAVEDMPLFMRSIYAKNLNLEKAIEIASYSAAEECFDQAIELHNDPAIVLSTKFSISVFTARKILAKYELE